jgi:hypothetical protein
MDRSMKVMFGMMTVAICLLAITMMGNQSQQAYGGEYVGGGDRGTEATIVWYDTHHWNEPTGQNGLQEKMTLVRAWSDGVVEAKVVLLKMDSTYGCGTNIIGDCGDGGGWQVISDPNEGLAARSDLNDDENVDIHDLLTMISDWGPAPPNVIPPSDCSFAMITP